MSASGYKQTLSPYLANVCFTPESGRKWTTEFMSAYDPEETSTLRLGGATLREKRAKISANVVRHGRHVTFQLAEEIHDEAKSVAEVRLDGRNYGKIAFQARPTHQNRATGRLRGDNYSIGCAV